MILHPFICSPNTTVTLHITKLLHPTYNSNLMAEEDFDVIINDKEYKELKQNKKKVTALELRILEWKQHDQSKSLKITKLQKEAQVQKEEIAFLQNLVLSLGNEKQEELNGEIDELQHSGNSASYEVLGQSIMFPKKVNPKQSQLKSSDLVRRYAATVEHVRIINEKLESQEELIKKLNQMNSEKNELLLDKNSQKVLEMIYDQTAIKISTFDQLKAIVVEQRQVKAQNGTLEGQCKERSAECEKLKEELRVITQQGKERVAESERLKVDLNQLNQQVKEKASQCDKLREEAKKIAVQMKQKSVECDTLKEQAKKLTVQCKQKEQQCEKLKEQIKKGGQSIADFMNRLKKTENELNQAKKSAKEGPVASSFGDRPYRIKLLIDEHIKEMQKSLGSVGGLSSQEINAMLGSQLKSLLEYIPKSMQKKK